MFYLLLVSQWLKWLKINYSSKYFNVLYNNIHHTYIVIKIIQFYYQYSRFTIFVYIFKLTIWRPLYTSKLYRSNETTSLQTTSFQTIWLHCFLYYQEMWFYKIVNICNSYSNLFDSNFDFLIARIRIIEI